MVAASVAAVAFCGINTDSSKKRNCSSIKHSEKNGSSFQQNEAEEEDQFTDELSGEKAPPKREVKRVTSKVMKLSSELDIPKELLRNLAKELERGKLILERKLLELYGLREQQSYIGQLQRNLEDKMAAIDMLNGAIDSLQDELKNLQEEKRQAVSANVELETTKMMLQKLQMKMDSNPSNMKGQLVLLEQQVSRFLCSKETSIDSDIIQKKLKAARLVELEFVEMQRMNKELELEKRKLTLKLVDANARTKALSNMTQDKIIAQMEEEISILRHANEGLSKEVERLQGNRFNMVEELVYQRWLNACLRFETQNYQTPSRKTSNSDQKAKQAVLNRGFDSISSFTSSTESNEIDSCSSTESSSNSRSSVTTKSGLMHSVKQLGRSKDDSSAVSSASVNSLGRSLLSRTGLTRRHSTSIIPSRPILLSSTVETTSNVTPSEKKILHKFSNETQTTPSLPRTRRVSFCDSVETCTSTYHNAQKSVEEVSVDKGMCDKILENANNLRDSSAKNTNNDCLDDQVGRRIEIDQTQKLHSRIHRNVAGESKDETSIGNPNTAALLILLTIMLLVYFLVTARIN